jgi:hypothetical protein
VPSDSRSYGLGIPRLGFARARSGDLLRAVEVLVQFRQ